MHDALILGSGRSGTSMVAGAFAGAGFHLGDNLHAANPANPKGFFEDAAVNALNEDMLALVTPPRPDLPGVRRLFAHRPEFGQRWVAVIPPDRSLPPLPAALAERRDALIRRRPLLFKDPRFSYTLPYWLEALPDARCVCVFREPDRTASSMVRECATSDHMRSLRFGGERQALRVWTSMYEHVLRHHSRGGRWLFVHYDQFLDGSAVAELETFLDAPVNHTFADSTLKRSAPSDARPDARTLALYDELCALAGHTQAEASVG